MYVEVEPLSPFRPRLSLPCPRDRDKIDRDKPAHPDAKRARRHHRALPYSLAPGPWPLG